MPSLAAGATDAGSSSITIPAGTPAGAYFLIAKADADNTVAELKETNNNRSRSIKIGPDLIVSAISAPVGAPQGATMTVTDTTRNNGGGAAGDSTTMIYLSVAPAFDARAIPLGSRSIPALAPGATYLGSTTVTIPAGTPAGAYYIIAVSDAGGVVAESSETNNSRNKSITVTP